ncbi:MAG TPA: rhomboid family intramembrane serine protease [Clostridia bacterium]|nr:rhomboid family intramembrane serine protease [Clostridia bacterium]
MIPIRDSIRPRKTPVVNWLLIGLNIYIFILQTTLSPRELRLFFHQFGVIPAHIIHLDLPMLLAGHWEPFVPLVSSMFLHGSWWHLLSNMLYLWVFGDNVEDRLGHLGYLFFYVAMGLIAALTHVWSDPFSTVPMVGASGAVAGVLGAYFVAFPRARVLALVPVFFFLTIAEVRAVFFLFLWFLLQALSGLGTIQGAQSVAWWAHIGGFLAGALTFLLFRPRAPLRRFP